VTVNVENMRKWVDRMRDPQAKQAYGGLREGDGMCCLGHACDVSGLGEWHDDVGGVASYLGAGAWLPGRVMKWLGVDGCAPFVGRLSLPEWNDGGMSLPEIADLIEAEWPEVKR
jgi:hypothetical protein